MAEFFEIIMLICFGVSWPINAVKSYQTRTAKGKSLAFMLLILFGYVAGITAEFQSGTDMANFAQKWDMLVFYALIFTMVSIDLCICIHNRPLDKERDGVENV